MSTETRWNPSNRTYKIILVAAILFSVFAMIFAYNVITSSKPTPTEAQIKTHNEISASVKNGTIVLAGSNGGSVQLLKMNGVSIFTIIVDTRTVAHRYTNETHFKRLRISPEEFNVFRKFIREKGTLVTAHGFAGSVTEYYVY